MSSTNPIGLAADVVAAFVSNNSLPVGELPALIHAVHTSIIETRGTAAERSAAS